VILSPALYVCAAHVLMRFCHLINRSFACKAEEGRHIRISNNHNRDGTAIGYIIPISSQANLFEYIQQSRSLSCYNNIKTF